MTHVDPNNYSEIERLRTLLEYGILDTPYEEDFDGLARLASAICQTPIALISMIDDKRQWYKAKVGIAKDEVPVEETFCQYTIAETDLFEIEDATKNDLVKDNPNVTPEDGIRYYAGLPLTATNGYNIGTLCVVDIKPRKLTQEQKDALDIIAKQVMLLLEFRRRNKDLGEELEAVLHEKIAEKERELQRKDAEYNSLLKAINKSSAVIELSPEGTILRVNRNFLDIVGYTESELIGQSHSLLVDPSENEAHLQFWKSLRQGKFISGRFRRIDKSGNECWIQASYNPVQDDNEQVVRVIKIGQNISKEIASNQALKRAKELADDLNIQKDYFIANMSHELRTPINAILGFTELLLANEDDGVRKEQLQSIQTAGDNLLYVVNDILDLSKIEAGIFQIDHTRFELRETIGNVFSILRLRATQKKLKFSYTIDEGIPDFIMGDKNRLAQILINLLGNAIKFTAKGKVNLDVRLVKDTARKCSIRFSVSDTGIGIPADKQKIIFERFTQAEENTSRKYGGTGLGLNISRLLIEKQGGAIHLESHPGKGSTFSFEISYQKSSKKSQQQQIALSKNSAGSTVRVLLCEDNLLNQKLVLAIFDQTRFSVEIAENGVKGLELFRKGDFDLVLMDVQMPEMNGYETTRIIREEMKSTVPIIALTAHSMVAERNKCLSLGMSDYLSKPFRKDELLQMAAHWSGIYKEEQQHLPKPQKVVRKFEHFSPEKLNEYAGGNADFEQEMIRLFFDQVTTGMDELKTASAAEDPVKIAETAHRLRSSFGMLDAEAQLLIQLEMDAKSLKNAELTEILHKLALQIALLTDELKQYLLTIES